MRKAHQHRQSADKAELSRLLPGAGVERLTDDEAPGARPARPAHQVRIAEAGRIVVARTARDSRQRAGVYGTQTRTRTRTTARILK
jgi:hypothetical protein